jgi:hypothetical protein
MVPCCDYTSEQDFEPYCLFGGFLLLSIPYGNRHLCLMRLHRWGRLSDHYAETLQVLLLFETVSIHRFGRAIPRLFVGMAHVCQPGARVNVSIATSKVPVIATLLSIVFISLS